MEKKFNISIFLKVFGFVLIWFMIAELPRYFLYVRPEMMKYLSSVPNMGRFGLFEICMWTILSCILVFTYVMVYWLSAVAFGNTLKTVFFSTTIIWLAVFVFYWFASATMLTAQWKNLLVTLPLAYIEVFVACYISYRFYKASAVRASGNQIHK